MKRNFNTHLTVIIIIIVLVGAYFIYNDYLKGRGEIVKVQGKIKDVALSAKVITLIDKENKEWNVTYTEDTKVIDEKEKQIDLLDLIPQFEVEVSGKKVKAITPNSIIASQVKILNSKDIVILSPKDGELLPETRIKVRGYARTDMNELHFKINDKEKGTIEIPKEAHKYSYFEKDIFLSNIDLAGEIRKELTLSIYGKNSKDDSEINNVSITLEIGPKKIFLYFSNIKLDPNMEDCTKVYPVEREVHILTKPSDVIYLLIQGPNEQEMKEGYTTSIPKETMINGISMKDGIARIDFSNLNPGGSCRVAAIRAQITQTLKQFPGVKEVIISVDGNVEEALQP